MHASEEGGVDGLTNVYLGDMAGVACVRQRSENLDVDDAAVGLDLDPEVGTGDHLRCKAEHAPLRVALGARLNFRA